MGWRCILLGHNKSPELRAKKDFFAGISGDIIIAEIVAKDGMKIREAVIHLSPCEALG